MTRHHTDEELEEILEELDENEMAGLAAGMLPARYQSRGLTGEDVARLMDLKPGGHL